MPRGKAHPPELRAKVVAALVAGASLTEVAREFGVSKTTAKIWKSEAGLVQTDTARSREAMSELIYDTITDHLTALRAGLQVASRPEWLAQQTAGDLAILLGTISDRTIRLLAGLRPADSDHSNAPPALP